MSYLAQCVEDIVEEEKDFAFGHFGNVIHSFASIVANTSILVSEAC